MILIGSLSGLSWSRPAARMGHSEGPREGLRGPQDGPKEAQEGPKFHAHRITRQTRERIAAHRPERKQSSNNETAKLNLIGMSWPGRTLTERKPTAYADLYFPSKASRSVYFARILWMAMPRPPGPPARRPTHPPQVE